MLPEARDPASRLVGHTDGRTHRIPKDGVACTATCRGFEEDDMSMVRFDPFRELSTMQDRINRIFGDAYTRRYDDGDLTQRGEWLPAVDIYENANQEIVLKAELPGITREDIDLRVENNTLTLRGERKRDTEVKQEQYHRVERSYGGFTRSFSLPTRIDTEKVRAEFKDGVLSITLPVKAEAKPRQIEVAVS
jgi:HSP20 family protein